MTRRNIMACDLGSDTFKAVLGCYNPEGNCAEILSSASAPSVGISKGNITDVSAVSDVVSKMMNRLGISAEKPLWVLFSIGGSGIISDNVAGECNLGYSSVVDDKILDRLDEMITASARKSGKDVVFYSSKKYCLDGKIMLEPLGEKCKNIRAENFLLYDDTEQKKAYDSLFDRLNCNEVDFFPGTMLSAEACMTASDMELGAVLVDFGYDTTDIAVFSDGNIQLCDVIPVGIHDIVNTLSYYYRIPYEDAMFIFEEYSNFLMKDSGDLHPLCDNSAADDRVFKTGEYNVLLEDICQQLMDRVVDSVRKHGYAQAVFSGYFLTGGLARIRGLASSLSACVSEGYKVKVGKSYGILGSEGILNDPRWSVVLGALKMMAMDEAGESSESEPFYKRIFDMFDKLFS